MQDEAARENEAHPEVPIRIGVGIHSGEVVETDNTFIGTAVNVAARVCAAAKPDEVLVTGTVRGLTHGAVAASFVSRGRKKLKGLAEPIEVFSALPLGRAAPALRRVPRRSLAAVAGVVVLVLAVVVAVANWPGASGPGATPAPTVGEAKAVVGELSLGRYQSERFTPSIHFTIRDLGWNLYESTSDTLGFLYTFDPQGKVDLGRPGVVYTDACGGGTSVPAGRSAAEFVAAVQQSPFLEFNGSTPYNVGGRSGVKFDVNVAQGAQIACSGGLGGEGIAIFSIGGSQWFANSEERFRVIAVDAQSGLLAVLIRNEGASATSVPALEAFFAKAEKIVQSINF
jgi:hypothetical protein